MIRCRHCEQWLMPTDPRTTMLTIVDGVPFCQHPGLRLATADEIAARDRDYQRRVLAANDRDHGRRGRSLRRTPASDDPFGADMMLRWAEELLRAVQRDGRMPDVDDLHDWLDVFDRRDSSDDQMIQSFDHSDAEPRCGWG